jgi:hypothetical protein
MHRRNVVTIHENGISYKGRSVNWGEIKSIDENGAITLAKGQPLLLPKMLENAEGLIATIRQRSGGSS